MSEEDWRLVAVAGVHLELPGIHPEVVLEESEEPRRQLRIPVGFAEGTAIAYAWRRVATPRPLTHELLADLLDRHGAEVAALRITGRQGATYVAELDTTGPRGRQVVSCRPSDGLALVLRRRTATPILVADSLLSGDPATPESGRGADTVPDPA
ncbi:MAG TPA: bifunctional nuclease family protein [Acidimicrobiales bacterium]|nr:bifunctional nuclease family protein [Acidimicrobiales bacterium]